MAPGLLKIANDSANLVNTTKKPDVFFARYDTLLDCMEKLSLLEDSIKFNGTKPSKQFRDLEIGRERNTHLFINRFYQETLNKINALKTNKAKYNKVCNFYTLLEDYFHKMSPNNIKEIEEMNATLEQKYGPNSWK
ncbi:phage protein [Syntrophobotulus glycolicus DSM 8271]|uniref:Phage protein n=2 Tax=Syntrophobotulus TaxID=51196 RepID=F0SXG9_SYNGF|nr:phage protein [Syntrophobotulus glycolicus DSM 8271]